MKLNKTEYQPLTVEVAFLFGETWKTETTFQIKSRQNTNR